MEILTMEIENNSNINLEIDESNNEVKTKNSKVGRPKKDRTVCAQCGLQKELVKHRVRCHECWNNYYKNYYSTKVDYANKKREYQRNYVRAKISSVVVDGMGEQ